MEFEHYFFQYIKNNIPDIRLIPFDHVTYMRVQDMHMHVYEGHSSSLSSCDERRRTIYFTSGDLWRLVNALRKAFL